MAKQKVFVVCPIGEDQSAERIRSDKVLKFIITPVIKELLGADWEAAIVRADKISESGRITVQILRELMEADVVICDLTDTNPNVMYELGIRQASLKPFVLLAEKGTKLPFDIIDLRTIFYQLDLQHVDEAKVELASQLAKAFTGEVAALDKTLFQQSSTNDVVTSQVQNGQQFNALLEVCQAIMKETLDMKQLISAVGSITLNLQQTQEEVVKSKSDASNEQFGMMLMNHLFQNPDGAEKVLPVIQRFTEFGEQMKAKQEGNRATRRKK